jgi:hypothetical protein
LLVKEGDVETGRVGGLRGGTTLRGVDEDEVDGLWSVEKMRLKVEGFGGVNLRIGCLTFGVVLGGATGGGAKRCSEQEASRAAQTRLAGLTTE